MHKDVKSFHFFFLTDSSPDETCFLFHYSRGSVIAEYLVTFDPESNETVSSIQSAIQEILNVNSTGTFLEEFELFGTKQDAVRYEGMSNYSSSK